MRLTFSTSFLSFDLTLFEPPEPVEDDAVRAVVDLTGGGFEIAPTPEPSYEYDERIGFRA